MFASDLTFDRPSFLNGGIVGFGEYLQRACRQPEAPVIWSKTTIERAIEDAPHGERGSVALINPQANEPGSIVRGLSLAVQIVKKGQSTSAHAHSFWHLYFIQAGEGLVHFGDADESQRVRAGDVVLFPSWCPHAFDNSAGESDLLLVALQNLPECASLGALVRQEPNGELRVMNAP